MISGKLKRLFFFWVVSYTLALAGYYLLWLVLPGGRVFGALYRMFLYHYAHPAQYLAIPCFFYGCVAALLANRFHRQRTSGQLFLTLLIFAVTVLLSSPFGGMLWHYHDMQAGYFPPNWPQKMLRDGFGMGLSAGWAVVALSFPYNLLAGLGCFFLTRKGAALFRK